MLWIPGLAQGVVVDNRADITQWLELAREGNGAAFDRLFEAVYQQLRVIAHHRRERWYLDETLNTTALVHEAYLKLVDQESMHWRDRSHFFAAASRAMRHILINYAERRRAAKRGGRHAPEPLEYNPIADDDTAEELIELDQVLKRLEQMEPRQARVVECRFFAGLPVTETAEVLEVSEATVKRDWALACAYLKREVQGRPEG